MANQALIFPELVLRLVKGAPLTFAEQDGNNTAIRSFCIALQNILSTSLNPDGTLIAGAVGVGGVPIYTDSGAANNYVVTQTANPITAYANGQAFWVYTANASTSASTLNVNGLGQIPILSAGNPVANQISSKSIFVVVYLNGTFVLLSSGGSGGSSSGTVVNELSFSGQQVFNSAAYNLAGSIPASVAHGLGAVPTGFTPVLMCLTADSGYVAGQSVPAGQFTLSGGGKAFLFSYDNMFVYLQLLGAAYVTNPATDSSVAITPGNWALTFQVSLQQSFNKTVFPALEYTFINTQGAFSYRNNLFVFQGDPTKYLLSKINLLNNEAVPLAGATTSFRFVNGAVFASSPFFNGAKNPQFVFTCESGLYEMPAVDPNANVIPVGSTYSGGGTIVFALVAGQTYTWTPAVGDTSLVLSGDTTGTYLASGGVQTIGPIAENSVGTTCTLHGTVSTICNGTLSTTGLAWSPTAFNASFAGYDTKPVWIDYANQYIYCASSDPNGTGNGASEPGQVSKINVYRISTSSAAPFVANTWAGTNSAPLDLTAAAGSAPFVSMLGNVGGAAKVLLFQYNPVNKRIYVATSVTGGMIHIFQIGGVDYSGNDFSAWFNTSTRDLTYIKSIRTGWWRCGNQQLLGVPHDG